ncbi:MAG: CDF family Co(II)/Ni(II) efflux transporter DmeF [Chloroflexaceae bacterium]|nr:CDF family Co(II)/Ni(II) efflux transporter DmeF [Chloroflexaceae bacterium]
MHSYTLKQWQHSHHFTQTDRQSEQRTRIVIGLTLTMMIVEIIGGVLFGSMALLADGWHMATHVAALSITAIAYWYARRHADNSRYSFGTGKVGVLGGFASAVALAIVALVMALESIQRFFMEATIQFPEAIAVAIVGLLVNLVSALLLRDDHHHQHGHAHDHDHDHDDHTHHRDHNLRAAYLHVLADALTSLLAIIALVAGMFLGWVWLDAAMGIVGALVITRWSWGLLRDTSSILLDSAVSPSTVDTVRTIIEADADNRVADLHIWQVGPHHLAVIITVVTHYPQPPEHYKKLLHAVPDLAHISVEVQPCTSEPCLPLTPSAHA